MTRWKLERGSPGGRVGSKTSERSIEDSRDGDTALLHGFGEWAALIGRGELERESSAESPTDDDCTPAGDGGIDGLGDGARECDCDGDGDTE